MVAPVLFLAAISNLNPNHDRAMLRRSTRLKGQPTGTDVEGASPAYYEDATGAAEQQRSNRAGKRRKVTDDSDAAEDEEAEDDIYFSEPEMEEFVEKKPRSSKSLGKRRKVVATPADRTMQRMEEVWKRTKGSRGLLKDMKEMPLDVLFEYVPLSIVSGRTAT